MKRFAAAIISLLVISLALFVTPAHAASEQIDSLKQEVTINQNSEANITETIDYNFGSSSHHGIERYYQLSSKTPDSKYYNLNFQLLGITQDGEEAQYSDSINGNSYYIRIGDPNTTITGVHRYVITYKMYPVVRQDPQGDYINYDVTGNDWKVPIVKATATITLPDGVTATQTRCYTGTAGSTEQDCTISTAGSIVTISSNSEIPSGQGLTANVLTPSGSFSKYLIASDRPLDSSGQYFLLVVLCGFAIGFLIIIVGIVVRLVKWLNKRRAEKDETIIAQYEAPDGLLPAEMGVLEDLKLNMTEITATIIDLAVKGYLKIRHVKDDKKNYEFVILKEDFGGLQDYEQDLMLLFTTAATVGKDGKTLDVSSMDKTQSSATISSVYDKIDSRLRAKNYYKKKISGSAKGAGLGIVVVLVFVVPFVFGFLSILWLVFPFICIPIAIVIASTPGHLTKTGYDEWAKVEGLKLFLTVTEKDRLKFTDAPKKNPALFSKLLPAAIALGVEKEWAKQFEGMDISRGMGWYDDYDPISSIYLAAILTNSFNSSLATSFAPPASSGSSGFSSGDFGGGGFSGGGDFGGGGGGSW